MRNDSKKEELLTFLSQYFVKAEADFQIVTNVHTKIIASGPGASSLQGFICAEKEEADERIILHLQVRQINMQFKV